MTVHHRPVARATSFAMGVALAVIRSGRTLAASPAPSAAPIGDPRAGQAAGFAGDPLLAIAAVLVIAVLAVAATMAWVRLTRESAESASEPPDSR